MIRTREEKKKQGRCLECMKYNRQLHLCSVCGQHLPSDHFTDNMRTNSTVAQRKCKSCTTKYAHSGRARMQRARSHCRRRSLASCTEAPKLKMERKCATIVISSQSVKKACGHVADMTAKSGCPQQCSQHGSPQQELLAATGNKCAMSAMREIRKRSRSYGSAHVLRCNFTTRETLLGIP